MRIATLAPNYPQPLANAYLNDFSRVSRFFTYHPQQQKDFEERFHYLLEQRCAIAPSLAAHLQEFNRQLGCGHKTLENIELLASGGAVAVVTGQQAGILTGPLYTVYKAMGTIRLATELSQRHKRPVVPVFWIGSDDHDFAEINHIFVPTAKGPQKIGVQDKPEGRYSVGHLPVPKDITSFFEQLAALTPPMGWQQEGLSLLKETAMASENLAEWFGRLMTFLFKAWGLVLINPVEPQVRKLSGQIFKQAVETAPKTAELLDVASAEVKGAGFAPQIQGEKDKLHLFYYRNQQRTTLYQRQGVITDRQGSIIGDKEQLVELARTSPESFSPDVVLRPLVQEILLPVLVYVAGPGEISYYAMLGRIFTLFNLRMPIIYPRPNITLVEPLVQKLIERYQVPLELVTTGVADYAESYLKEMDGVGVESIFKNFRQMVSQNHNIVVNEVTKIDPELSALGKEHLKRLLKLVDSFEDKVQQRHRKKHQTALGQFQKLNQMLHPQGEWQERMYNIFPYLLKYGPSLVPAMMEKIDPFDWRKKVLFFD
ncbi:bacillithiol biosynthesis cysteine-adding enzyme BshC [Desulforamulus aeronauticus]|uniref:Putative cysteine ligase BshC n=1 Tax=Desulforamulus aeronauticus DSM 10349 TaxID=1121421 RepID=A0A1M6SRE6_9FIRM|nr:bacillithiol biosynthesis cysteine-adding enzyme BshC [Desulforamulus aeronauticus]SHK47220.1 bacillithiol biosynthesis cysteine-adding enzyme BshC [Desulforamulus aeronauticus DSM 10349]